MEPWEPPTPDQSPQEQQLNQEVMSAAARHVAQAQQVSQDLAEAMVREALTLGNQSPFWPLVAPALTKALTPIIEAIGSLKTPLNETSTEELRDYAERVSEAVTKFMDEP